MALGILDKLQEYENMVPEKLLCKGLNSPFNNHNSANRKMMYNVHSDHRLPLYNGEIPFTGTPYSNQFGKHNSSLVLADCNYDIVAKISKFKQHPDHDYVLVLRNRTNGAYHIVQRKYCKHNTEEYGYLYDNKYIDSKTVGDEIKQGDVIRKSQSCDEFLNKLDGVNAQTVYMNIGNTTEDGYVLSTAIRDKFASPLIHRIPIIINTNDVPLNLLGGETNEYKSFPEIGETIKDGILCALRVRNEAEALYMMSYQRLKEIMVSDRVFTADGVVVDINILCNDPTPLSSYNHCQLAKFYNESIEYSKSIVNVLKPIVEKSNDKCSYDLKKLYLQHTQILSPKKFTKDKAFSFVMIEFVVEERSEIQIGDKITNRHGGKGVVAGFLPPELMPDFNGRKADIIANSASVPGRLNIGQCTELSSNMITSQTIDYLDDGECPPGLEYETYLKVIQMFCPTQYRFIKNTLDEYSDQERAEYLNMVCSKPAMYLSLDPISQSYGIDELDAIYKECPWVSPYKVIVSQKDSNGNYRQLEARRTLVSGMVYYYRLKQHAKEKFSATSLSPTNLRGENTRSRSNKLYQSPFSRTPIAFGNMETGNLEHLNPEVVILNLMIHSASPHGRRLAEVLSTGDPFDVNVMLDDRATNRNAEIFNAYLKTMGIRLVVKKTKVEFINPVFFMPVSFHDDKYLNLPVTPVCYMTDKEGDLINPVEFKDRHNGMIIPAFFKPVTFYPKGGN